MWKIAKKKWHSRQTQIINLNQKFEPEMEMMLLQW